MFILSRMAFANASYITSRGGLLAEISSSIKNKEEFLVYSLKGKKELKYITGINFKDSDP